ncbi:MAG TPA: hypothetical protein VFQ61_31175 [Polyangiaceae bacterium]|nr:hypothetical protein [Polyangiaceae bacterium]
MHLRSGIKESLDEMAMMNQGALRSLRVLVIVFTLVASACCHHDVRLEFPESDAVAGIYECSGTTGPQNCQPSTVTDPAAQNSEGTVFVMMPAECKKQFHRIVIQDAGSASPRVRVECAPLEAPIPALTPIPPPAAPAAPGAPAVTAPSTTPAGAANSAATTSPAAASH